jgi:hypothetical protein
LSHLTLVIDVIFEVLFLNEVVKLVGHSSGPPPEVGPFLSYFVIVGKDIVDAARLGAALLVASLQPLEL